MPKVTRRKSQHQATALSYKDGIGVFRKYLEVPDTDLIDLELGIVAANDLPGDPAWLFNVGAPSTGKTELARSLTSHQAVIAISTLTPATLISGYERPSGEDPSLIPKLNGKTLVIKDFTPVLGMNREKRAEIFSMFRDAYDGECSKAFGTGLTKSYKSRFNIIAGVTDEIYAHAGSLQALGERFLRYASPPIDPRRLLERSMRQANNEPRMRMELAHAAMGMIDGALEAAPQCADYEMRAIMDLAELLSRCRTTVKRDAQKQLEYQPQVEGASRIAKQLLRLGQGIAMVRRNERFGPHELRILTKVTFDSLPWRRAAALRYLMNKKPRTAEQFGDELRWPKSTAWFVLQDMELLEIVTNNRGPSSKKPEQEAVWQLTEHVRELLGRIAADAGGNI